MSAKIEIHAAPEAIHSKQGLIHTDHFSAFVIDGDGVNEVIFGTGDGRVYAYNTQGKILDGFPLLAGKEIKSTPALVNSGGKFGIIAYSTDGYLYGWKTSWNYDSTRILWKNYLSDKYHSNSNFSAGTPVVSGPCLPEDKVYNWPNPVYGKSTNIRYFLNGTASSVTVKILDLSGELVRQTPVLITRLFGMYPMFRAEFTLRFLSFRAVAAVKHPRLK